VHDALDAAAGVSSHGHDVAAVAQGDDGFLERAGDLGVDQALEARAQAFVGDTDGAPHATEGR